MDLVTRAAKHIMTDIRHFSRFVIGKPLRRYQLEPAEAIVESVLRGRGLTFAVMMARQAGKNEVSAQIEAYLLNLYQRAGGSIVKASPTFKPQTVNSLRRLLARLDNPWNRHVATSEQGYIVRLDRAEVHFFSAEPTAHVVGATASLLLEGDEAQDILGEKWDKDFRPMAASRNATTVLWGTAWTGDTLLARTIVGLRQLEMQDGHRRVFVIPWEAVAEEVPAYGDYVRGEIARLGREHPLIRTQYDLQELAAVGGLFHAQRQALMRGVHPRRSAPTPGRLYAFLLDAAGGVADIQLELLATAERAQQMPRRDATALTIVEVDTDALTDPGLARPTYRVVDRHWWLGEPPARQYGKVRALADTWQPRAIVVDATGVGEGLASFLAQIYGERVVPVRFSAPVKSQLGWEFLGIVETGRYQDYADDGAPDTRQFWYEVGACQYEIVGGQMLRWGVWESPRYEGGIARGHDDLLLSAALVAMLDKQVWARHVASSIVAAPDPVREMDRGRF